jgi:organic radical activating enzyme
MGIFRRRDENPLINFSNIKRKKHKLLYHAKKAWHCADHLERKIWVLDKKLNREEMAFFRGVKSEGASLQTIKRYLKRLEDTIEAIDPKTAERNMQKMQQKQQQINLKKCARLNPKLIK